MSSVDEVDLPVLMSMVKDKLENPDRAWFLEVKLSAREWEKLVKCYYDKKQGAVEELERKHNEVLKIIYDVIGLEFSFKNELIKVLEKAQKERLKELKEGVE
jgi:hypothetical protein